MDGRCSQDSGRQYVGKLPQQEKVTKSTARQACASACRRVREFFFWFDGAGEAK